MNRATQLARGAATASVALLLAAFSHGVAAGEAPGWAGLALSGVLALAASVAFVGRRSGVLRTALAVGASQLGFHLLFSVGTGDGSLLRMSGEGHHRTVAVVDGVLGVDAGAAAPVHVHGDVAMLLGHVLAGLATVVYLLAVEAAVWRTLARAIDGFVRSIARDPLPAVTVVAIATSVPEAVERARLRGCPLLAQLRHRGPPLLLVSA